MEARSNESGILRAKREEGRSSLVSSGKGIAARTPKARPELEEDWAFLGIDDPAFWLKESGRE
jgi:hypothetical protein